MNRTAELARNTKETQIRIVLDLDGTGVSRVSTGIGFYDHMLESFIRHGGFDATIETKGDLHIDMHHTVEDTGIVIGHAVAKALDGFKGIRRFGLAQGLSLPHAGRLGSLCASEVIAHYGPRPQVSLKDLAAKAGL